MKRFLSLLAIAVLSLPTLSLSAHAADLTLGNDADSGFKTFKVTQGDTAIEIVPEAGCNIDSIHYKGTELLKRPKSMKELPGYMYGVPVLYPTPNRVRGGVFTFDGQKFTFPPNDHGNFLHGLVHSAIWEGGDINIGDNNASGSATLGFHLPFAPGSEQFKLFPLPHTIELAIKTGNDSVRWTYTVDNSKGDKPIPYGFAIHPWFLYQGSRKETFVTIPATHLMEAQEMLPTGKLLDLATQPDYDAREPRSLEGFLRDDVYYGIEPTKPAMIDFREAHLKITLSASAEFNHLVLYTPKDQPWFCVENQTCSTDAHNLYAAGFKKESNLLIVEPGKTATGWVEFRFEKY